MINAIKTGSLKLDTAFLLFTVLLKAKRDTWENSESVVFYRINTKNFVPLHPKYSLFFLLTFFIL